MLDRPSSRWFCVCGDKRFAVQHTWRCLAIDCHYRQEVTRTDCSTVVTDIYNLYIQHFSARECWNSVCYIFWWGTTHTTDIVRDHLQKGTCVFFCILIGR